MNIFAQSLGLVSESDYLSLSDGLYVKNNILHDCANHAQHVLQPKARKSLEIISKQINASTWWQLNSDLKISDIQKIEILFFLNKIGGLTIHRSNYLKFKCAVSKTFMMSQGFKTTAIAKRFPGTLVGLITAILKAVLPVVIVALLSIPLAYGANLSVSFFATAQLVFLVSLIISTFAHEGFHLIVALSKNETPKIVLRRLDIGVLHGEIENKFELISSIFGPLIGFITAMLIASFLLIFRQPAAVYASAGIIGFFHLLSWLPGRGDYVFISKYLKENHA